MDKFYEKYDVFLTAGQYWQVVAVSALGGGFAGFLFGLAYNGAAH